jgi:sugar lactone lactonase YvrE
MELAARTVGVDVSVPIDPAALSADFYQPDGMHLNREGAVLFTSALAKDLPERVALQNTLASGSQAGAEDSFSVHNQEAR